MAKFSPGIDKTAVTLFRDTQLMLIDLRTTGLRMDKVAKNSVICPAVKMKKQGISKLTLITLSSQVRIKEHIFRAFTLELWFRFHSV